MEIVKYKRKTQNYKREMYKNNQIGNLLVANIAHIL